VIPVKNPVIHVKNPVVSKYILFTPTNSNFSELSSTAKKLHEKETLSIEQQLIQQQQSFKLTNLSNFETNLKSDNSSNNATIDGNNLNSTNLVNNSFIAKGFLSLIEPSPRINPSLPIRYHFFLIFKFNFLNMFLLSCFIIIIVKLNRGNSLYVYGGITELGYVEVTLDDCWSLDLNKRDVWKKVNNFKSF
jgi:hypothetical protein